MQLALDGGSEISVSRRRFGAVGSEVIFAAPAASASTPSLTATACAGRPGARMNQSRARRGHPPALGRLVDPARRILQLTGVTLLFRAGR
jgi:hypothetical protein